MTGNWDGTAKVWDTDSGREILNIAQACWISCVAVSPDGQRLATGSLDGTAQVWDLAKGRGTLSLQGHTGPVSSVAVTPDGWQLLTGSEDMTAKLWEIAGGRKILDLKHTGRVSSVAVSPDGLRLATASTDGTKLWDAVGGRELLDLKELTGHLMPDGQRLVVCEGDGTAKLWDIVRRRELLTLRGHIGLISSVAVTPNGRRLITGSRDLTAVVWDMDSARALFSLKGYTGQVTSITVTPDEQRIVTGTIDGTVQIWDAVSGHGLLTLKGHTGPVWSVAVTPDGRRIVTGGADGTVRLWDAGSGRELLTLKRHRGPVWCVAVTPDGRRLITGSEDSAIKIWEAASPEQVALWVRQEQDAARRLAAWQRPDGSASGFVQDWLVLAPLALQANQSGAQELEREQRPREASLQPRAGDRVSVGGQEFTWQAHHAEASVLDFNRLVGKLCDRSVAYAVCYVNSQAERNDLLLQVGSDDEAKVYLNGQEVYKYTRERGLIALDPIAPIALRKGTNVLVFKVVNEAGIWEACARFVDPEGNPAEGLRVSLVPEP
jgi:WD40 repeat protein